MIIAEPEYTVGVALPTVPQRDCVAVLRHLPDDTFVSIDAGGLWKNARACWSVVQTYGTTHCMVIQDDVEPVPDFMEQVLRAIRARPRDVLSLFCARERDVVEAEKQGASFLEYDSLCWGQAVVMPREQVSHFLRWADGYTSPDWKMDDQRIAFYCAMRERRVYATVPSLVQHAKDLPSTWANRDGSTLQAARVGTWEDTGLIYRPHQRSALSFLKSKLNRGFAWVA